MKYILVMGASGDIGQACVKQLAREGYSVYCHYHTNRQAVDTLVAELSRQYPQQDFFAVPLDMTDEAALPAFVADLFEVNGIVFASGGTVYKLLADTTPAEMDRLWQVHVKTPVRLCQLLHSKLVRRTGSIVFVSSVYGLIGSPMEVMYSTLKGAQLSFVKAYAGEVASSGITVNAVAPGAVDTQMNQALTSEEKEELISSIPAGRLAQPAEIAASIVFLLSDKARYITGSTLPVTGGWQV